MVSKAWSTIILSSVFSLAAHAAPASVGANYSRGIYLDDGSSWINFQAPVGLTSNYVLSLPVDAPAPDQALVCCDGDNLKWAGISTPSGTTNGVAYYSSSSTLGSTSSGTATQILVGGNPPTWSVLPAQTSGNNPASGSVGHLVGTQNAGTDGSSYSTRSTTSYSATNIALISSPTLAPGNYTVSFSGSGYAATSTTNLAFYLAIGGAQVTNLLYANVSTSGIWGMTLTVPIVITSPTTVEVYGALGSSITVSNPAQEMWIISNS